MERTNEGIFTKRIYKTEVDGITGIDKPKRRWDEGNKELSKNLYLIFQGTEKQGRKRREWKASRKVLKCMM